jgi:hypothetical protein
MANELAITASFAYTKFTTAESQSFAASRDVVGNNFMHHVQNVGFASDEVLVLGDVTVGGYFFGINRDGDNFVQIFGNTGDQALAKLLPGDFCMFRVDTGATVYVQADTDAVLLEYWIWEE